MRIWAQIESAAKVANAYHFIMQKEMVLTSNIGDRGSKLSGRKAKTYYCTCCAKKPPILILDRATSSLDTESERLVQDAINNMMQNRTSIVITQAFYCAPC